MISTQHREAFARRNALVADLERFLNAGHFLRNAELLRMIRRGASFEFIMGHIASNADCQDQISLDEHGDISLSLVSPLHPDDDYTNEDALMRGIEQTFNLMAEFKPALNFREIAYDLVARYNDGNHLHYPIFHGFEPEEILDHLWFRPGWNGDLESYENRDLIDEPSQEQLDAWEEMSAILEAIQDLAYQPATPYEARQWGFIVDDLEIYWSPLAPHIVAWPGDVKAVELANRILEEISKLNGHSPALASFKVSPEDKYGVYYFIRHEFFDAMIFGMEYSSAPRDSEIGLATDDGEFMIN